MELKLEKTGTKLTVQIDGRLDTVTAPVLERELMTKLEGLTELALDLKQLEYVSSAGLRVLMTLHKAMLKQGRMTVRHANESVMEIFEITGFVDILNIE